MKVKCAHCGNYTEKQNGAVNRALKIKAPLYCNQTCAGLARRKEVPNKKELKREYDRQYRLKNLEKIKRQKHEHFKKTYDPEKASIERKANMHKHLERMRQPKWVEYKKKYDKVYKAKKNYGEFWECAILINTIESQYSNR